MLLFFFYNFKISQKTQSNQSWGSWAMGYIPYTQTAQKEEMSLTKG